MTDHDTDPFAELLEEASEDTETVADDDAASSPKTTDDVELSTAERTRQGHIEKAKKLLAQGKDLPESLQYTKKYIDGEAGRSFDGDEDVLAHKIQFKLEDKLLLKEQTARLKEMSLSKDELTALKESFGAMSKDNGEGKAMKVLLDLVSSTNRKTARFGSLPQASAYSAQTEEAVSFEKMSPSDQKKFLKQFA